MAFDRTNGYAYLSEKECRVCVSNRDRVGWWWRVEPWASRLGYNVFIVHRTQSGNLAQTVGPNGGPYVIFGTRKRAMRKGERLVRRRQRAEANRVRLSRTRT